MIINMENSRGFLKEYLVIDIGNELIRRGEVVNGATYDKLEKLTIKELRNKLSKLMG